jgi:hypothetical protein
MTTPALMTVLLLALAGPMAAPQAPTPAAPLAPDPSWKALGPSLWLDPAARTLHLQARVCLREGDLEHLLCLERSKEHESILVTDARPRAIHAGLLAIGAKVGHPVRFDPKFEPPAGSPIAIEVRWTAPDGTPRAADARTWVKDHRAGTGLPNDWVFAGSLLIPGETPDDPPVYAADAGDLITVANFTGAILDVPLESSASDASRSYAANTDALPPLGTRVWLVLKVRP